jgi:hypothetical protein
LAFAVSQRDALEAEKELLRCELLETRQVRDGYLSDRASLNTVLSVVRAMRERLLEAHRGTESSLTTDANDLKRTVEACLSEIAHLHAKLADKKALCGANEHAADTFRDRMSSHLRDIVSNVGEFKLTQDANFAAVVDGLLAMRSEREREFASLGHRVTRMFDDATKVLGELQQQAKSAESALKVKTQRRREETQRHRSDMAEAFSKLQGCVLQAMNDLRSQAAKLDTSLAGWTQQLKQRVNDSAASCKTFTTEVVDNLQALRQDVATASANQLQSFEAHTKSMKSHVERERDLMAKESERLSKELTAYITRAISDFSNLAVRRGETAISGFCDAADHLAAQTNSNKESVERDITELSQSVTTWNVDTQQFHSDTISHSATQQASAAALVDNIRRGSVACDETVSQRITSGSAQVSAYHDRVITACKEADTQAESQSASLTTLATRGSSEASTHTEALRKNIADHTAAFDQSLDVVSAGVTKTEDASRAHVHEHSEALIDVEGRVVKYVMQDITRDLEALPSKQVYRYPTEYAATQAYGTILANLRDDFQREDGINRGELAPGQPVDYSGQKGPEDWSGLLTSTKSKPLEQIEQSLMDETTHESDAEVYSTVDDGPDDEETVEEDDEAADGAEDEGDVYNPHDLGEDVDAAKQEDNTPQTTASST